MLTHKNDNLRLTQQRKAGYALPSPFTLHQVTACKHWELFPTSMQAIFACRDYSFQQSIVLTRMLASSSSSHSLGSFPSFSRVGCKEHGCVRQTTEPPWALDWAALGQSRAALICKLCFFPRPYFNFLSFNTFFLVVFSLSLILFCVSLTCKCPPRANVAAWPCNFTSSTPRRF